MQQRKTVGIIGGMGPIATCDLYKKIIERTDAQTDQEHLRIYIDSHAGVPNRSEAILQGGESPVPYLVESGRKLVLIGADFLVMGCNTSHYYLEEIQKKLSVPILDMVQIATEELIRQHVKKAALLATEATVKTGIYQKHCMGKIELMIPNKVQQKSITDMIYQGVKKGDMHYNAFEFQCVVRELHLAGAESIILGCTELPVAIEKYEIKGKFLDPTLELAKAVVHYAGANIRS